MGYRADPYAGLTQFTTGTNADVGLTTFPASDISAFILSSLYKKISYFMSIRLSSVAIEPHYTLLSSLTQLSYAVPC
jgi:hypothetical protein